MTEGKKCCEKVFRHWDRYPCGKLAKVEREGKPYCTIHDPERQARKRAESEARWRWASDVRNAESRVMSRRLALADAAELWALDRSSAGAVLIAAKDLAKAREALAELLRARPT